MVVARSTSAPHTDLSAALSWRGSGKPLDVGRRVCARDRLDERVELGGDRAPLTPEERHVPKRGQRVDRPHGEALGVRRRERELADDTDAECGAHERYERR